MKFKTIVLMAIAICIAGGAFAQDDAMGKIDTLTITINNIAAGKWMISASLWNDEEIAAFDIPLKYAAGMTKLNVDSISYAGSRVDYFAQKYSQVDTTGQVLHFGGIAYVGSDKPPLAPGNGEIGKVFITVIGDKEPGPFVVDTTTFIPKTPGNSTGNKLMLVDRNAKAIVPFVRIVSNTKKAEKK